MGWQILVFYPEWTILHTIHAAKFEHTITQQHVLLLQESQSY